MENPYKIGIGDKQLFTILKMEIAYALYKITHADLLEILLLQYREPGRH